MTRAITLVLTLALVATPALSDLPDPVATATKLCLTEGPTMAERVAALEAGGFALASPDERPALAAAIAPLALLAGRMFGFIGWADDPAANQDRLTTAIALSQSQAERTFADIPYLVAPGEDEPIYLNIEPGYGQPTSFCRLILPPGDWAAEVAAMLGLPAEVYHDSPQLMLYEFTPPDGGSRALLLVTYSPLAFGGIVTRPGLLFPSVATPEPAR